MIHAPLFKSLLLVSIMAAPVPTLAQQISSEWSPLEDAYGSAEPEPEARDVLAKKSRNGDGPTRPRVDVVPYIEAQQVLVADLKGGGDVLTYSTVAAGIDASVVTQRTEAQVNLRYERLISYDDRVQDQDNVNGLARGSVALTRNFRFDAGGVAARTRVDGRGAAPLAGNADNVTQVYSVYAGPSFTTQAGQLSVNASYRAGYTRLESQDKVALPSGQQRFDQFDDSISQVATASVGMQPGVLPVGWTVSASWKREDAGQLDSRLEGKYARADVILPVSPTFGLVGGVGYEVIEISERDALRDASGLAIVGTDGRLVTDPASPRLIAYAEDGLIWDAGVSWRPSPRTALEARYGHRYGTDSYVGSFSYQPGRGWGVNVSAYDSVSGFGGLLGDNLASLPTQFRSTRNPLSGDLNGCAFGESGGYCLNDSLQGAPSAAFRQRGVTASFSGTNGGWDSGVALGYNQRKFIASRLGAQAQIDGLTDENYFAAANLGRNLDRLTRFESNLYASYSDPGFSGAPDTLSTGANAALYRQIIRGLSASAAVGVDSRKQDDVDRALTASALLGLRYSF